MKERCAGREDDEDEECTGGGGRSGRQCARSWKTLQRCNGRCDALIERRRLSFVTHMWTHAVSTGSPHFTWGRVRTLGGGGLPWACSSSLLSSSECGWLLPLVTFLALLLDRTPAPERSITEGMTAKRDAQQNHAENGPRPLKLPEIYRFKKNEVSE